MAVKVRGSAFMFGREVDSPDADFQSFFSWLLAIDNQPAWPYYRNNHDGDNYRREFFIKKIENGPYCGVVISARTSEFRHYVSKIGNKIKITAKNTNGNPPVEVNFFCIRSDNYKGIYSNYHGSYAFSSFLVDLWRTYAFHVKSKYDLIISTVSEIDGVKLKKKYSLQNKNYTSPLYTPGSFNDLLKDMARIREVRYTTYELTDDDNYGPVGSKINNVHKTIRFNSEIVDSGMKDFIYKVRALSARVLKNSQNIKYNGSVFGFDSEGKEYPIDFDSNLDDHLDFDYDDLGDIDIENIYNHTVVKQMMDSVNSKILFK